MSVNAVFAINKPKDYTSFDVCAKLRRALNCKHVGHSGTLDPFATGVLIVACGQATKLCKYFTGLNKEYIARISFGLSTDTDDLTGNVLDSYELVETFCSNWKQEFLNLNKNVLLQGFLGKQMQIPPQFSAIKKNGVRAYKLARANKAIKLDAREICVYDAEVLAYGIDKSNNDLPYMDVRFLVSSGTYIRALARDIGQKTGYFAHLSALERTKLGCVDLSVAYDLDVFFQKVASGELENLYLDPCTLLDFDVIYADDKITQKLNYGQFLDACIYEGFEPEKFITVVHKDKLIAICKCENNYIKPVNVFKGISGVRT
ncbi:MAG: tRNA pseudouridine(55) synthase TruB [Coriobacteriales bacterium]|nr:tRNA pseudouridine(55) synthase TruB [Coriobacteriales bacterium]